MITEDYVSFETAKLLKEKGFNELCNTFYENDGTQYDSLGEYITNSDIGSEGYCSPTLQTAMKWLRKEHGLHIIPRISRNTFLYGFKVVDSKGNVPCVNNFVFDSNEEACEAGIKYCLENLI